MLVRKQARYEYLNGPLFLLRAPCHALISASILALHFEQYSLPSIAKKPQRAEHLSLAAGAGAFASTLTFFCGSTLAAAGAGETTRLLLLALATGEAARLRRSESGGSEGSSSRGDAPRATRSALPARVSRGGEATVVAAGGGAAGAAARGGGCGGGGGGGWGGSAAAGSGSGG